jgi:NADH-quinone oxidoreductase subunit M
MTLAALLLPFISGLLLFVAPKGLQRALVLISTVFTFLTALGMVQVGPYEAPWLPGFGVYLSLSAAGAGGVLVTAASLVMIPTALYASFVIERRTGAFLALLLLMQAGLNGIFLAQDLVLFYVFWEATLIPSVVMLGVWGLERRRQAAITYLLYAVAGSFIMLVAILAVRPLSGAASYRLADLIPATQNLPVTTQVWLFLAFTLAFAVKLPLWPVHGWLPDFHEQNHASGIADVAVTLYKVGGWGFFAFALPLFPAGAAVLTPYLLALAAFTAVYAGIIATAQTHLKRLLAYASLSHMGIVGVGVFGMYLAGLNGAMYLLAAQMLSTGGMFLLSGMLYRRRNSFELSEYGGLARPAPMLAAMTLFVTLASIGVPGLSNFPGEFMSLLGAFERSAWLGGFATLSVIAAGVYGVNLYQRLYQGPMRHEVRDLGRLELVALVPFIVGILWFGVFPQPHMSRIEAQAARVATFDSVVATPVSEPAPHATEGEEEESGH